LLKLRLKTLWNMLGQLKLGESGIAYVVDSKGQLVAHPTPSEVFKGRIIPPPITAQITSGITGEAITASAKVYFGENDLVLVTEYPTAEAFQKLSATLWVVIALSLFTLLLVSTLGIALVRRIIRPIEGLHKGAIQLSQGDFSGHVDYPIDDELGELAHSFNTMAEQLKVSIDKIKQERTLLQDTIDSLAYPFYVYDPHDLTIKLTNSVATFNTIGKQARCFRAEIPCHNCGKERYPCSYSQVMRDKRPVIMKREVPLTSNQQGKVYMVHGYPILDSQGEVSLIIEYVEDITEQAHLEEQLRQSQKLEALGSLAGGIAHDFNNLLTSIIGFAEYGLLSLDENDPLYEDLQSILNAGEHGTELTQQLLSFSRKRPLKFQQVNLSHNINKMSNMIERVVGKMIQLNLHLEKALWNIHADSSQMDQVILNLAINARDAIKGKGQLTIETHNIVLNEHYCANDPQAVPGAYVIIEIRDSGEGIPSEVLDKIFDPFFTTKGEHGTGMGLATVYGIVSQHKGFIKLNSEVGVGSRFRIYLPVSE